MSERKLWSEDEDRLLREFMLNQERMKTGGDDCRRMKWGKIAQKINGTSKNQRTGKQCRQRWHNQLKPGITEATWTTEEEEILFNQQDTMGNKWTAIAQLLPGRTDNNIKNYFYSMLRKSLRKVNHYVYGHKKQLKYRNIKKFKQLTLSKMLAVSEHKQQKKISIKSQHAKQLARTIKNKLMKIQIYEQNHSEDQIDVFMEQLVDGIQQFNRICKKRKAKKRDNSKEVDFHHFKKPFQHKQKNIHNESKNQQFSKNKFSSISFQDLNHKKQIPIICNVKQENNQQNQIFIVDPKSQKQLVESIQNSGSFKDNTLRDWPQQMDFSYRLHTSNCNLNQNFTPTWDQFLQENMTENLFSKACENQKRYEKQLQEMMMPAYYYHPFRQNYIDSFNFHRSFYNSMCQLSTFNSLQQIGQSLEGRERSE